MLVQAKPPSVRNRACSLLRSKYPLAQRRTRRAGRLTGAPRVVRAARSRKPALGREFRCRTPRGACSMFAPATWVTQGELRQFGLDTRATGGANSRLWGESARTLNTPMLNTHPGSGG